MDDASKHSLASAADHWEKLASEQSSDVSGQNRASLYRRTAKSIRIQIETGVAVCVCCLLPFGAPGRRGH
jgi:hypothetical protein